MESLSNVGVYKGFKMRKLCYSMLFFTIISSSAIHAELQTIYFPNDDYLSIQETIDHASAGDTIIVKDGEYREDIIVEKSLIIRSENGPDNCTINTAEEWESVFKVTANQVEISGFTLTGATQGFGAIWLCPSTRSSIAGNVFYNNRYAIRLDGSHYNIITGNLAEDSDYAHICLYHSDNNRISGNTCSNNDGAAAGIDLYESSYNTVKQNTCSGNYKGIDIRTNSDENTVSGNTCEENSYSGICLSTKNNAFSQNTCNSNGMGFWGGGESNLIMENNFNYNEQWGLYMKNGSDNTLSDNTYNNNNKSGIVLAGSNFNTDIKNNICNENKGDGISLCAIYSNHSTTISNNTCSQNSGNGITSAKASENITILGNTCQENGEHGIYLYLSNSYIVQQNTANSNEMDGIHVREGPDNVVCLNTCNYNKNSGIVLSSCWADNTTIANNNVWANNTDGIYLASDNNTVKDNSIISNNWFGIFNIGYDNTISGNRLDSNGEAAINNGKKLQLPMEEYNINTNISGNEVLNSPIGVKTTSSRQEDWQDILVDNTFSNVPKKFCQAWTLYIKAVDEFEDPIVGAKVEILYNNGSLYKQGWTREDGYLVADAFGFTPSEFYIEDNNTIVHDSPYTINASLDDASISKEIILDDNKAFTFGFLNIDFFTSAQMNVCKENIDLDLLLVTLYGETTTAIDVNITDYDGAGIGGTSVNLSTTVGYFTTEGDKSKSIVLTSNGDGQVSTNLLTENLNYTIGPPPDFIEVSASIESGQTETLIIPIVDNLQEIKRYYYNYVPKRQTDCGTGALVNCNDFLLDSLGIKPNPYHDWVCQAYQNTVLNLLDRIRLNDGSYLKYPPHFLITEYYPRTDYLLNGLEYGPIQALKIFHHAVIVYETVNSAQWMHNGEVFDPWIMQTPEIYKVWDWDLLMGHSIDIERVSWAGRYPLQGVDKYPATIIGLGCHGFDPYQLVLPNPTIPDMAEPANQLKDKQAMGVVDCPVDILITDSEGAKTGILPDGTFVNESESAVMAVLNGSDGYKSWYFIMDFENIDRIDFTGTDEGAFTAQFLFNSSTHSLLDHYTNVPMSNGQTASLVIDETQSFPIILGNGTQIYPDETDPPATVTNLREIQKRSRRILWEWDNPVDADFDHALIYVDERYKGKVTKPEHTYLATGLDPETEYTISVYTVDELGNMNITEVNDTATTGGGILLNQGWNLFSPIIEPIDENTDRNISLRKGWNMFGYSSDTEFLWINALVSDGVFPIPAVMASGWLQPTIYYYDANVYRPVPTFDNSLRRNKGYWIYAFKDDLTLILPSAGGSLIGNSCLWSDAQLENATEIKTLQDAQQAGWLQGTIYYFDENSQYCKSIQGDDYIYPWRGYWLWVNETNLILTFAESTCGTSESADSFQLQFYHYMDDEPGVRDPTITPDTFAAIGSADPNVAKEGVDYKDGVQPPAIPNGDYVQAYTNPNIPETPVITIDYRPLDPNNPNLPDLHYPIDLIAHDDASVGLTGTIYFNLMDPNDLNDIPAEAMVYLRRLDENGNFVEWYDVRDSNNYNISWRVTSVQGLHATMELEILDKCLAANADGLGLVDFHDFAMLASNWKKTETNVRLAGDIDGNGEVNSEDLALITQHWLCSCD